MLIVIVRVRNVSVCDVYMLLALICWCWHLIDVTVDNHKHRHRDTQTHTHKDTHSVVVVCELTVHSCEQTSDSLFVCLCVCVCWWRCYIYRRCWSGSVTQSHMSSSLTYLLTTRYTHTVVIESSYRVWSLLLRILIRWVIGRYSTLTTKQLCHVNARLPTLPIFVQASQLWGPFYASMNFRRNCRVPSTYDIFWQQTAPNGTKRHR